MSGGSLNYFYYQLEDQVGVFRDKELDELVADLAELFHDREWYDSGDYGKGDWLESRDAFKEKWFTKHGREERIERYLEEYKEEIYDAFGIDRKRCRDCKHWSVEGKSDKYGKCEHEHGHLNHCYDTCEKWEARYAENGLGQKDM